MKTNDTDTLIEDISIDDLNKKITDRIHCGFPKTNNLSELAPESLSRWPNLVQWMAAYGDMESARALLNMEAPYEAVLRPEDLEEGETYPSSPIPTAAECDSHDAHAAACAIVHCAFDTARAAYKAALEAFLDAADSSSVPVAAVAHVAHAAAALVIATKNEDYDWYPSEGDKYLPAVDAFEELLDYIEGKSTMDRDYAALLRQFAKKYL